MSKWVTYDLNREHNLIIYIYIYIIEPTNCPPMSKVHKVIHEHVHFRNGMLQKTKNEQEEISNLWVQFVWLTTHKFLFPYYTPRNNNQHTICFFKKIE